MIGVRSIASTLHTRIGPVEPAATDWLPTWITQLPAEPDTTASTEIADPAVALHAVHSQPTAADDVVSHAPQDAPEPARFTPDPDRARVVQVNQAAWEFWTTQTQTPGDWTREYLSGRGLPDVGCGFAPPGWQTTYNHLRAVGFTDADLVDAGLVGVSRRGSLYDTFRDRLVLPVYDQGDLVGFTARRNPATEADAKAGDQDKAAQLAKTPKYLNSRDTAAYDKSRTLYGITPATAERLRGGAAVALVEGAIDVEAVNLIAAQSGIDVVPVAPLGTAFTALQLQELRTLTGGRCLELFVALDDDDAGRKAALKVWDMLTPAEAATARSVTWPGGKDPAELVEHHHELQAATAIVTAPPMTHTLVDAVLARHDLATVEGQVGAVTQLAHSTALLSGNQHVPAQADLITALSAALTTATGDTEAFTPAELSPWLAEAWAAANTPEPQQSDDTDPGRLTPAPVGANPYEGLIIEPVEHQNGQTNPYTDLPAPTPEAPRGHALAEPPVDLDQLAAADPYTLIPLEHGDDDEPLIGDLYPELLPPDPGPLRANHDPFAAYTPPGTTRDVGHERVRAWATAQAERIAHRLDQLTEQALAAPPEWLPTLQPTGNPAQWHSAVRRVLAYRDRYEYTRDDAAVPARGAGIQGLQEEARADADAAYQQLVTLVGKPAPTPASVQALAAQIRAKHLRDTAPSLSERIDALTRNESPSTATGPDRSRTGQQRGVR